MGYSTKEFKEIIKKETSDIAQNYNWDFNNQVHRGYVFQLWMAQVFSNYDQGFDTDPEDSLLKSHDLKADILLEDNSRHHLLIAQCKYESLSKKNNIKEGEVNDFFNRHMLFMDRDWVLKHGSEAAKEALEDYGERIKDEWSVEYYFVSTLDASSRTRELPEKYSKAYADQSYRIRCHLLDFSELKDFYTRSRSFEQSIPEIININLPRGQFIERTEPYPTIIAVLKGNCLRDLYKQHKEALFADNIRGYLGNRGINENIRRTAKEEPANFFYFNNGITAICTEFNLEGNKLEARKCQIINGAQTVGALGQSDLKSEVEVMFRFIKTKDVATDKGINSSIILYNNTQNTVKISDFRSNDKLQIWLERKINDLKPKGILPSLRYIRKRSQLKRGIGQGVKLEDFAKIRYSFLFEPTRIHESPKDLWTLKEDKGVYEDIFGVNGELLDSWDEPRFEESLIGIAFSFMIEKEIAKEIKENKIY